MQKIILFLQQRKLSSLGILMGFLIYSSDLFGQPYQGFQTNRYEPTSAGEWGFIVDHPWFSSTRYFAADFTLNYANKPLVFGDPNRWPFTAPSGDTAIEHQIIGHANLAFSFLDRLQISLSWPVTFWEQGMETSGIAPIGSPGYGDPRIGLMVRLLGQPYEDGISLSLGGVTYIPLRKWVDWLPEQLGDQQGRFIAKLVLSGVLRNEDSHHAAVWSIVGNFYFRPEAVIGTSTLDISNSTSHQLQIGAALGYGNLKEHFHLGVEALLSTDILRGNAFQLGSMSLDLLLGTHIPLGRLFSLHLAGGVGLLHQSATADARFIAQFAFAPWPKKKKAPEAKPAPISLEQKATQSPTSQAQGPVSAPKSEGTPATVVPPAVVAPAQTPSVASPAVVAPAQTPSVASPAVPVPSAPAPTTTVVSPAPVQPIIVTPAAPAPAAGPAMPTTIVVPIQVVPVPAQPAPASPTAPVSPQVTLSSEQTPKPAVTVKRKPAGKKKKPKGKKKVKK